MGILETLASSLPRRWAAKKKREIVPLFLVFSKVDKTRIALDVYNRDFDSGIVSRSINLTFSSPSSSSLDLCK